MQLIMFNTLMGVCAGGALALVPRLWAAVRGEHMRWHRGGTDKVDARGWAVTLGVLGAILFPLGLIMSVVQPLSAAKPWIDALFGQPSLMLGVLLLAAAWFLARHSDTNLTEQQLRGVLTPVSRVIVLLGLIQLSCAAAIIRFDAVSGAPPQEPITGRLHNYPWIENLFFGLVVYGLSALGCLLFPAAVRGRSPRAWHLLYWCWTISGHALIIFSAANFYTHTGMLTNLNNDGPDYHW